MKHSQKEVATCLAMMGGKSNVAPVSANDCIKAESENLARELRPRGERTNYPESALQMRCVAWFLRTYPEAEGCLFHVPNEGKRSIRQGERGKRLGMVSGVADLVLIHKSQVVFFELKSPLGSLSESQRRWRDVVTAQGFPYHVIRTIGDFRDVVTDTMGERLI